MLKIKQLTKLFDGKKILNNVSFSVSKGKVAVLLGKSGVGKSTLLRILNHLETIDSGTVELDEKKLDLNQVHKTHTVGMVFQNFNLFEHMNAEENIAFVLEKSLGTKKIIAQKTALQLLQKYELEEQAHKYPSQLSGGQKQRLALARSLALKPKIICLDEPTSALDPLLTSYVAKMITQLAHDGLIVLIATHDTTLLEKLDCTIHLMDHGTIIETVESKKFYKDRKNYQKIDSFVSGIQ